MQYPKTKDKVTNEILLLFFKDLAFLSSEIELNLADLESLINIYKSLQKPNLPYCYLTLICMKVDELFGKENMRDEILSDYEFLNSTPHEEGLTIINKRNKIKKTIPFHTSETEFISRLFYFIILNKCIDTETLKNPQCVENAQLLTYFFTERFPLYKMNLFDYWAVSGSNRFPKNFIPQDRHKTDIFTNLSCYIRDTNQAKLLTPNFIKYITDKLNSDYVSPYFIHEIAKEYLYTYKDKDEEIEV